ncbi:MAG: hypothetical protein ACHQEM_04800 [Chitinophagales bacterium]
MKNSNKRILLIIYPLAAVALLFTACNQKQPASAVPNAVTDLASDNLKGNITQVESDSYKVDSTGKMGPIDEKNIEKFDSSGFLSSSISTNGKDSIKSQSSFQHDGYGYMTAMQTTGANNEKKSSMVIEYDGPGKFTVAKAYDSTGKLDVYYADITKNQFGEVTGAKGYHKDSTLKLSFVNEFDSIYYVGGSSKDSVGKLTYSGKGTLNDKKDISKWDETTVTTDPKTKKDSTKNTSTTYTYENWDSHGNWTQQTSLNEKGKPTKIVKRIIIYKE